MSNNCEEQITNLVNSKNKNKKKKFLKENLKFLNETEHKEIFKLIKKNSVRFSENSNGIFININKLTENKLNEIILFIFFCKNNSRILKKNITIRNKLENLVKKKQNIEKNNEKIEQNNYNNEFVKGISYEDKKNFNFSYDFKPINFEKKVNNKYIYSEVEELILNDLKYKN